MVQFFESKEILISSENDFKLNSWKFQYPLSTDPNQEGVLRTHQRFARLCNEARDQIDNKYVLNCLEVDFKSNLKNSYSSSILIVINVKRGKGITVKNIIKNIFTSRCEQTFILDVENDFITSFFEFWPF